MTQPEDTFGRVVSLAVHDLRTPLATLVGFARTLQRAGLADPQDRYVDMMIAAGEQLADILDDLGVAARIEGGRWEPNVQQRDTAALAQAAAGDLDGATSAGDGRAVLVDEEAAVRAVTGLARCALLHGGLDEVSILAEGPAIVVAPITAAAAPVLTGESLKDLGAAIGARVVGALGGSVELAGDRLVISFRAA